MTSSTPRDPHSQFGELVVGYVLNSLEPADEALVEAHLPSCKQCQASLEEWRAVAGHLAYGADSAEPSVELRSRLLAEIADEARTPQPMPASAGNVVALDRARKRPSQLRRPQLPVRTMAAAAAAISLIAGGTALLTSRHDTGHVNAQLAARAAAFDALSHSGAHLVKIGVNGAENGFAIVDGKNVWLGVQGLPRNDVKLSTYVLWAKTSSSTLAPVATFDVTSGGLTVLKTPNLTPSELGTVFAVSYEQGRVAPAAPNNPVLGPNVVSS